MATLALGTACGSNSDVLNEIHGCQRILAHPPWDTRQSREQTLQTGEGSAAATSARMWDIPSDLKPRAGLLFVSGMPGGFTEPVDGIYQRLAERFAREGFISAFVEYREPGNLEMSVEDALAGAAWLRSRGVRRMALLGWSFGGAVITHSALRIPEVKTVIGFSAQSLYTEAVSQFKNQSLLLFASYDDDNVPYEAASQILDEAPASIKKELRSLSGYDHYLSGAADQVDPVVEDWIHRELKTVPCN